MIDENDEKLQEAIRDAYILFFSGAAKYKVDGVSKGEVKVDYWSWRESELGEITVEFVDGSMDKSIVRGYYDGELWIEAECNGDGKLHGDCKKWSEDWKTGKKECIVIRYKDGKVDEAGLWIRSLKKILNSI